MENIKEKMTKVQSILDEYENKNGLPKIDSPCNEDEISKYFKMTKDEVESLSPVHCDEIALRLTQQSIHIRRLYNIECSRQTWCDTEITNYICDKLDGIGGQYTKYENKIGILAKTDSFLSSLLQFKSYAQQRKDRLENLANDLNNLKFVFLEIKKTKMKDK